MADFVGIREGTGHLRGPNEDSVEIREQGGTRTYLLGGEALANGDEIEIRLRGNRGWISGKVTGLPGDLQVVWQADDGKELRSSLSPGIGIRRA